MQFQFNEHSVCINPERIMLFKSKTSSYEITIASDGNKWCYGYNTNAYQTGSSCPCMQPEYSSREDAVKAACEHVIRKAGYFMDKSETAIKEAIKQLTQPVYVQAQLF